MHFYSYGSQNYHDVGWGCVYRSMQNVQSATGRHVNTVPELLHAAHKQRGEWAEPGLFLHMYPGAQASSAGTVHPLHSRPSLYTHRHMSVEHMRQYITQRVLDRQSAFIVDDTESAYAVVLVHDRVFWVDPHATHAKLTLFKDQLYSAPGWLALEVPHVK